MFIDFYNKGSSPGPGPSIVVDQHYNSGSSNAQSGTAVAEAIDPKQDKLVDANSNNGQVPTAKAVYDDAKRILNNQYSVNSSMTFAQFLTNAGLTIPGGYAMCYVRNWNNISDKPWSADACYVEVLARDNNTRVVRVTTWVGSRMAIISQTNGTWGTWRLIGELS